MKCRPLLLGTGMHNADTSRSGVDLRQARPPEFSRRQGQPKVKESSNSMAATKRTAGRLTTCAL